MSYFKRLQPDRPEAKINPGLINFTMNSKNMSIDPTVRPSLSLLMLNVVHLIRSPILDKNCVCKIHSPTYS